MATTIIKFSSEECGTCHRMSHYDSIVSEELGCNFINVMLQDTATYRKYRKILLEKYPDKKDMGWPTYILITGTEEAFKIIGEIKGGMGKGEFRDRLNDQINNN